MTIWIDGVGGNDSPAGANNIARLATVKASSANALKTLARLAGICNGAVGEGAVNPLQGETIYINGEVGGTLTTPDVAFALFNCASLGSPALVTSWPTTQPTPPSGSYAPAVLRGDVNQNGVTFTYTGITVTFASVSSVAVVTSAGHGLKEGTQISFSSTGTLPGGITAGTTYYVRAPLTNSFNISATIDGALLDVPSVGTGTISGLLYWTGTLGTPFTSSTVTRCLIYADEATGADGSSICELDLVADATAVANTKNSYFINGSRVIFINFTDTRGIVQNALANMRLDSSSGQGVSVVVLAALSSSAGTSANALACFQTAQGTVFSKLTLRNPALTSFGQYPLSTEQAKNVVYEDISIECGGHHFIGFTGTGDQDGNIVRRCYGNRGLGQTAGAFSGSCSFAGATVTNGLMENCTWENGILLNPAGDLTTRAQAYATNLWTFAANNPNGLSGMRINKTIFRPKSAKMPYINAGGQVNNTTALTAGQELVATSYPVQFNQCMYGPSGVAQHFSGGTNTVANSSHRSGLWYMTGSSGLGTAASRNPPFIYADSDWSTTVPAVMPRNILFQNMLFIIKAGQRSPFIGGTTFVMNSLNMLCAIRFKDCVIIDLSKHARGCTIAMFDYGGAAGNCVFNVESSIIITQPQDASGVVKQLCFNDNGLANAAARRKFTGNTYVGFTTFSSDTNFDTQAEWLASVDTTATFAPAMNLQNQATVNLIAAKLGGAWMNGLSVAEVINAALSGISRIPSTINKKVGYYAS